MKIKLILVIAILSIFIVGCESKEEINLTEQGKTALEKHEYTEAKELFSQALEIDGDDEHARAMYMQATRMLEMKEYEEQKNYKKAIKELEFIENIKGGSSVIKSEASSKKKEFEKLKEEHEKAQQERKANAKKASSNDAYKVERDALREYAEQQKQKEEEKKKQEQANQEQNNQQKPGTENPNPDESDKNETNDEKDD
ncbi:hypothetical protein [Romboutsia sp.]|uniref:hypothetical protein n=1 Tax=Romboutsia sp. TaxID=1965302 RepID=UPI003F391D46